MFKLLIIFITITGVAGLGLAACEAGSEDSSAALNGIVHNELGQPLADIVIALEQRSTQTDIDGAFALTGLRPGEVEVSISGPWYESSAKTVTLEPGDNEIDFSLRSLPLKVTPTDLATYETYQSTFDWGVDTISIAYAPWPTRAEIEKALYHRNPALFTDPSGEPTVAPNPLPNLGPGGATGLDFVVVDPQSESELPVFDVETAVDSLGETPLSAIEKDNSLLWEPAVELYVVKWNFEQSQRLYLAGQAVRSERFGGTNVLSPVSLEHLYLHGAELWVELVFQPFLVVGEGITDSNGDGYPEIFVRLAAELYTDEVTAQLSTDYLGVEYTALDLVDSLAMILDDLYSRTNPQISSTLGLPYAAANGLTFEYPFAVLEHSTGAVNVLLVEP